jgi:hypothetical protein
VEGVVDKLRNFSITYHLRNKIPNGVYSMMGTQEKRTEIHDGIHPGGQHRKVLAGEKEVHAI